jgi:RNA polymerase sigma factor (sigma-70 family)
MKKHRKQKVDVGGVKCLVDVPDDDELYKADNHAEYQRSRSRSKHLPLTEVILADSARDVADVYEEAHLLEHLRLALDKLNEKERRLVEYYYYDGLTERKIADILGVSHQYVGKQKRIIINKLRNSLKDWL